MDPRNISLSLSSTSEAGHTTTFTSDFEGASAPWADMHRIYAGTAEQIHKLVHVEPVKQQGMAGPVAEYTFEKVDPEVARLMTGRPWEAAKESWLREQREQDEIVQDYGVDRKTAAEVQILLERKDRNFEGLKKEMQRTLEKKNSDLEALHLQGLKDHENLNEKIRKIEALKKEVAALERDAKQVDEMAMERIRAKDKEISKLRSAVENLQGEVKIKEGWLRKREHRIAELRDLNTKQGTEIHQLQETNRELNDKYDELLKNVHDDAMEDTSLQDERDIARKERDRALRDLHDLQVVHADLQDRFTDQTERLNESQRSLRASVASKHGSEEKLKEAARQHGEKLGKALLEAVEETCSAITMATGSWDRALIYKQDAVRFTKGIIERVAQNMAPSE